MKSTPPRRCTCGNEPTARTSDDVPHRFLMVAIDSHPPAETTPNSESSAGVRPLTSLMRWLLYAASALVFLAGLQLTVFSEQTETYFAWTVSPPLTAAFLGAAYWAAAPVELIAARQRTWAQARVAVPAIWLFTTLTLVITLVPFDRFHFSSPVASAQIAAWFWLAIYAGVP